MWSSSIGRKISNLSDGLMVITATLSSKLLRKTLGRLMVVRASLMNCDLCSWMVYRAENGGRSGSGSDSRPRYLLISGLAIVAAKVRKAILLQLYLKRGETDLYWSADDRFSTLTQPHQH